MRKRKKRKEKKQAKIDDLKPNIYMYTWKDRLNHGFTAMAQPRPAQDIGVSFYGIIKERTTSYRRRMTENDASGRLFSRVLYPPNAIR